MQYTIYQTTNNIDGKIYVGSHKTKNLNDGYMGSGKILNQAIDKYGIENFTKDIFHVFDTSKEMYDKEAEIVDESFVQRSDTYNIRLGGSGGWDHINDIPKEERPNLVKIKELKEQGLVDWGGIQNRTEEGWKKVRAQYWGPNKPGINGALNYEQMTDEEKKRAQQ